MVLNERELFLTTVPEKNAAHTGQIPSQIKWRRASWVGPCRELIYKSKMTVLWEQGFEGIPPLPFPSSGCPTTGSHCDCGLLVFKATTELGRGEGEWGELKYHSPCCFFTRIRWFFLNKHSLNYSKPLVKFPNFWKCWFITFLSVSFMEERILVHLCYIIFADIT